jgi:putative transposase
MYKLYRSKRNKKLHRLIHIGGVIHNHCIALCRRYYKMYKQHLSLYQLKARVSKNDL